MATLRAPRRLWVPAGTFPKRMRVRQLGVQRVAIRADSSCLFPVVVSARGAHGTPMPFLERQAPARAHGGADGPVDRNP